MHTYLHRYVHIVTQIYTYHNSTHSFSTYMYAYLHTCAHRHTKPHTYNTPHPPHTHTHKIIRLCETFQIQVLLFLPDQNTQSVLNLKKFKPYVKEDMCSKDRKQVHYKVRNILRPAFDSPDSPIGTNSSRNMTTEQP